MPEVPLQNPLLTPSLFRRPDVQSEYEQYAHDKHVAGDTSCGLCDLAREGQHIKVGKGILEIISKNLVVVENAFPYAFYDGYEIKKHHMLLLTKHRAEIGDFSLLDKLGYIRRLGQVSKLYDTIMTRPPQSDGSSVKDHLHTHLFKLGKRITQQHHCRQCGINQVNFSGDPHQVMSCIHY